jgi:Family of unknown function (DUF6519)
MSRDYSRERFDPRNNFSGILQQQGKVQLDAHANELVRIHDRRTRAQTTDTLGRSAVPRQTPEGFKIGIVGTNLTIGPGRIYVDGVLAENHGTAPRAFDPALAEDHGLSAIPYGEQPYLPAALTNAPAPREGGPHLVYLTVFERELSYLEEPALVEPAIGLDTVTALQTVWQVRVLPNVGAGVTCSTPDDQIPGWSALTRPSAGRLTTGTADVVEPQSSCVLESSGGYRGLENQLYRVEIHDGGKVGKATFKWSRDNGSIATSVLAIKGSRLSVARTGLDAVLRFNIGDWVEILDDTRELTGRPGEIRRLTDVVDDMQVLEIDGVLPASEFADGDVPEARHLRIRRWDQRGRVIDVDGKAIALLNATGSSGVIPVQPARAKVLLENGVFAMFDVAVPDGEFKTGDYWTFAARIATATVETLDQAPPRGIHQHYCKLALVAFPGTVTDCRVLWPPEDAAEAGCACICVSPAAHANGRPSLQAAVDEMVKAGGGSICLDVGEYLLREPLRIDRGRSIRITGKGPASQLLCEAGAIQIVNGCDNVTLENFAVMSRGAADLGAVISIFSSAHVRTERLRIRAENPTWSGIALGGALQGITIRDNVVNVADGVRGVNDPFAYNITVVGTGLSDLRIEDNEFSCTNTGVRLDGVSVHQFVSRVAGNHISGCRQAGIVVTGTTAPGFGVEISGNDCLVQGDGIVAGLDGLHVHDNNLHVFPERPPERPQRGIVLTRTALADRLGDGRIVDNRLLGFAQAIAAEVPVASLTVARNRVVRSEVGVAIRAERMGTLAIDHNHLSEIVGIGIRVRSEDTARVSTLGNAVDFERGPGVLLECPRSDCIVADNQVQQVRPSDAPGILVLARTAAASANRLIGRGLRLEIQVDQAGQPLATVLGNIAGGEIMLNGAPLGGQWDPLNQRFVV